MEAQIVSLTRSSSAIRLDLRDLPLKAGEKHAVNYRVWQSQGRRGSQDVHDRLPRFDIQKQGRLDDILQHSLGADDELVSL